MNGQTGRIAVTKERQKKSFPWAIEPTVYTIVTTLALSAPYKFNPEVLFLFGAVFACLFFAIMSDGQNSLVNRVMLKTDSAKANREDDVLIIDEKNDILKNPFENTPVFIEPNEKGEKVKVKIRFYTLGRMLYMMCQMLSTIFLPLIPAVFLRLAVMKPGEGFMDNFHPEYGAAWYVLAFFIVLLYFAKGIRRDIYEHPLLYEILPDGRTRRIKQKIFKPSVLAMFGIGQTDKNGKVITLFGMLKELGGAGCFLSGMMLFIIIGCAAAMVF